MFSNLLLNGITALAFAVVANATSTKAGSTVEVDGTFYYVPSASVSSLSVSTQQLQAATVSGEDLIPLTVMTGDFSTFNASSLTTTIASYLAKDDVFNSGFLQGIHSSSLWKRWKLIKFNSSCVHHLFNADRATYIFNEQSF